MTAFGIECYIVNILQRKFHALTFSGSSPVINRPSPALLRNATHRTSVLLPVSCARTYGWNCSPYCSGIEPDRITRLAVCIVFLWSAAQPGHHIVFCRKNHTHTQTWYFRKGFVAGYKVHTYFDCSIGSYQ